MPSESPTLARWRLRVALRGLRDDTGLTQHEVADALEWSPSKVIRIEHGEVGITRNDLLALLSLYQVTDAARTDSLVDLARVSRQKGSWAGPRLSGLVSPATLQLVDFERAATAIRCFEPTLIPGLLQTEDYAAAVFDNVVGGAPAGARAAIRELAAGRYANVFNHDDPPQYFVVLDESVLLRQVGGPTVMADQLRTIIERIDSGRLVLRIVPLERPTMATLIGPFTLVDLKGGEPTAVATVLYREAHPRDEILHDSSEVDRHRTIFEQMWRDAVESEVSTRLARARLATLVTSAGRPPAAVPDRADARP
jgi:transcriptional regulator with XRE-family HTH domain